MCGRRWASRVSRLVRPNVWMLSTLILVCVGRPIGKNKNSVIRIRRPRDESYYTDRIERQGDQFLGGDIDIRQTRCDHCVLRIANWCSGADKRDLGQMVSYKVYRWAIGFWKATVAYMLPRLPPNVNVGCCTLELHRNRHIRRQTEFRLITRDVDVLIDKSNPLLRKHDLQLFLREIARCFRQKDY